MVCWRHLVAMSQIVGQGSAVARGLDGHEEILAVQLRANGQRMLIGGFLKAFFGPGLQECPHMGHESVALEARALDFSMAPVATVIVPHMLHEIAPLEEIRRVRQRKRCEKL